MGLQRHDSARITAIGSDIELEILAGVETFSKQRPLPIFVGFIYFRLLADSRCNAVSKEPVNFLFP